MPNNFKYNLATQMEGIVPEILRMDCLELIKSKVQKLTLSDSRDVD